MLSAVGVGVVPAVGVQKAAARSLQRTHAVSASGKQSEQAIAAAAAAGNEPAVIVIRG